MKSSTATRVFFDTNVFAYRFDTAEPVKQELARQAFNKAEAIVISTQVMLELHSVLYRKFRPIASTADVEEALRWLAGFEVVPADADLVLQAARTARVHQLSMWDAMIIEAARLAHCSELWTEDLTDGALIRDVRIVNPFAL